MENLFEYLISKQNKGKVSSGVKSILSSGDIVYTVNKKGNECYYMYMTYEEAKNNGYYEHPGNDLSLGIIVFDIRNIIHYSCLADFDNNLYNKENGEYIQKIYKSPNHYTFNKKDSKSYIIKWIIEHNNWPIIWERK